MEAYDFEAAKAVVVDFVAARRVVGDGSGGRRALEINGPRGVWVVAAA